MKLASGRFRSCFEKLRLWPQRGLADRRMASWHPAAARIATAWLTVNPSLLPKLPSDWPYALLKAAISALVATHQMKSLAKNDWRSDAVVSSGVARVNSSASTHQELQRSQ